MIKLNITKILNTADGKMDLFFDGNFERSKTTALFGKSGAGKTTLLRIIAGLETPDSGKIVVDDEIWFDSEKKINLPPQSRKVGFVFQDFGLFPNMSVYQNIAFALPKDERKIVDDLLAMTELTSLKDQKPPRLSGGQKQRVALARAVAIKPKILLLDEPLSSLDRELRASLQDEIVELISTLKMTAILVSHDLKEVLKMSQNIFHLENGTIKQSGHTREIFLEDSKNFTITAEIIASDEKHLTLLIGDKITKVSTQNYQNKNLKTGNKIELALLG